MSGRRLIEAEAKRLGIRILSARYERPVELEMGDGLGGWVVETDAGVFGGTNAAWVVQEMREALAP